MFKLIDFIDIYEHTLLWNTMHMMAIEIKNQSFIYWDIEQQQT